MFPFEEAAPKSCILVYMNVWHWKIHRPLYIRFFRLLRWEVYRYTSTIYICSEYPQLATPRTQRGCNCRHVPACLNKNEREKLPSQSESAATFTTQNLFTKIVHNTHRSLKKRRFRQISSNSTILSFITRCRTRIPTQSRNRIDSHVTMTPSITRCCTVPTRR